MYVLKKFKSGFEYIEISNAAASAKIALQGAHMFSFKRNDTQELLWVSSQSAFENGVAIRGGIPLCWPRFGNSDKSMPQHGCARTAAFELLSVKEENTMLTTVHFVLKSSKESKKLWNYEFELEIIFYISDSLKIEMITTNKGKEEFLLTQAFHTYFAVSNIENVEIFGLENKAYLDTLTNKNAIQQGSIKIDKEIDRIYKERCAQIILQEKQKTVEIESEYSASVIVWNPWVKKCSQMAGMQKEGYKSFVCIENANALDDFRLVKRAQKVIIGVKYVMPIQV